MMVMCGWFVNYLMNKNRPYWESLVQRVPYSHELCFSKLSIGLLVVRVVCLMPGRSTGIYLSVFEGDR
jgi:hypothetical protein